MSKTTRVAAILERLDVSNNDSIDEIAGSTGRDLIGTATLRLGSRSLTTVPVYRGDNDGDLRRRGIEHARMVDQKLLPYVQNPAVKVVRQKLGEEKVPHIVSKTLFPGYSVKDFADVVASVYGAEATEKDALKQLDEIFKDIRDDAEYLIKKYWPEISGALIGESSDEKVTTCDTLTEARLSNTQKILIQRFAMKPDGVIEVSHFRGAGVRGASKPEGKREYDAAKKLIDMGIFSLVEKPKRDYHNTLVVRLEKPEYLDMELPDKLHYTLEEVARFGQRIAKADSRERYRLRFGGRRGPSGGEQKQLDELQGMGLIRTSDINMDPILTPRGAQLLMDDRRTAKIRSSAERAELMDYLKGATAGEVVESADAVDEDVSTVAELKMYVGQFFNAKDVDPKAGSWYLMPAPDGKPMLFTVTGSKDDKAFGKFGILEFGRPVRNLKETFWYLDMFEYTTGDKIKPATSDIVVSAEFADKLMKDLKIKVSEVPTPTGEHTPDRFEKQTKYTVLV